MFNALAAGALPETRVFHMVDESLIGNTIRAGGLQKEMIRRIVNQIEFGAAGGRGRGAFDLFVHRRGCACRAAVV